MKLQLAALIATAAIAIVAAVFAIWPVVTDAPWEDTESQGHLALCESAIQTRDQMRLEVAKSPRERAFNLEEIFDLRNQATDEIERYC